jgi:hypothetical protein
MNKFPPLFKFLLSEKATAPKAVRNLSLLLGGRLLRASRMGRAGNGR